MRFRDRRAAGQALADALVVYAQPPTIVLGLPRGGVIVAREVAIRLEALLDVLICQKIGAPGNPEYAIGALAEVGEPQFNRAAVEEYRIGDAYLQAELARARKEIDRRKALYRGGRDLPLLAEQQVVLVDDGMATGYTMLVAALAVKQVGARQVVVAVPVAPPEAAYAMEAHVDRVVCLHTPSPFFAVGLFYENFEQVSDDGVRAALKPTVQE